MRWVCADMKRMGEDVWNNICVGNCARGEEGGGEGVGVTAVNRIFSGFLLGFRVG